MNKLKVISPRTRRPLRASPRRFRYTFASRLVQEGASQRAVADALDHSDLQQVQVYFDIASGIVEHLDAAIGEAVRPLADAFLGRIVRQESDAVRGADKASRIYIGDAAKGTFAAVGTCGTTAACGLTVPIACYTCPRYQPWAEAPHRDVLAYLERQQARNRGIAGRMSDIYESAIAAVKVVIALCDEVKPREAGRNA